MDVPTKTNKPYFKLIILIAGFILSSCVPTTLGDSSETPQVIGTSTVQPSSVAPIHTETPQPLNTEYPTLTPTFTPTIGPSPTLAPTPAFPSAQVNYDFLFANQPPGCQLPCWQSLAVGQSNAGDVQHMFDVAFGFYGSIDFFADAEAARVPGFVRVGYLWESDPSIPNVRTSPFFKIDIWVDENTRIVEGVHFETSFQTFEPYITPQRILSELGRPSSILVKVFASAEDVYQGLNEWIILYYDAGIFIHYFPYQISIDRPNEDAPGVAEVCLSSLPTNGAAYLEVAFVRPFVDGPSNLSPIQDHIIGDPLFAGLVSPMPFEEVFDLSLDELMELIQEQENLCIRANVE